MVPYVMGLRDGTKQAPQWHVEAYAFVYSKGTAVHVTIAGRFMCPLRKGDLQHDRHTILNFANASSCMPLSDHSVILPCMEEGPDTAPRGATGFKSEAPLPGVKELRRGGSRPPLVCVSPTGSAEGFGALAAGLPGDLPVIGLDGMHLSMETKIGDSMEAQAARFLSILRETRPRGPYRLAGFSFGAHVAYEMARRLIEEGDDVTYLGIIDTWPANRDRNRLMGILTRGVDLAGKLPKRSAMAFRARRYVISGIVRMVKHMARPGEGDTAGMTVAECLEAILLDIHRHGKAKGNNADNKALETSTPHGEDDAAKSRFARMIAADKRAMAAYCTPPIPVHVFLMASKAERNRRKRAALERGWRRLARNGLTAHWFACGHVDLIREPMATEVARAMGKDLDVLDKKA